MAPAATPLGCWADCKVWQAVVFERVCLLFGMFSRNECGGLEYARDRRFLSVIRSLFRPTSGSALREKAAVVFPPGTQSILMLLAPLQFNPERRIAIFRHKSSVVTVNRLSVMRAYFGDEVVNRLDLTLM